MDEEQWIGHCNYIANLLDGSNEVDSSIDPEALGFSPEELKIYENLQNLADAYVLNHVADVYRCDANAVRNGEGVYERTEGKPTHLPGSPRNLFFG